MHYKSLICGVKIFCLRIATFYPTKLKMGTMIHLVSLPRYFDPRPILPSPSSKWTSLWMLLFEISTRCHFLFTTDWLAIPGDPQMGKICRAYLVSEWGQRRNHREIDQQGYVGPRERGNNAYFGTKSTIWFRPLGNRAIVLRTRMLGAGSTRPISCHPS